MLDSILARTVAAVTSEPDGNAPRHGRGRASVRHARAAQSPGWLGWGSDVHYRDACELHSSGWALARYR